MIGKWFLLNNKKKKKIYWGLRQDGNWIYVSCLFNVDLETIKWTVKEIAKGNKIIMGMVKRWKNAGVVSATIY